MAKVTDTTPQAGNLVRVAKPKMLTLTGSPANTTAFKVLRSDTTTEGETAMSKKAPAVRRVRRSDTNPIMQLTFPAEYSQEDIAGTLEKYGMTAYNVAKSDAGLITATRSDLKSITNEPTTSIKLTDDGIMATVSRSDAATEGYTTIKVVGFEFGESHTAETAQAWLTRNGVDIQVPTPENSDAAVVVKRSDVPEGTEVRRMDLGDDDVVIIIVQADEFDAPDPLAEVVSDTAYGNWGWGFMDFNMSMADAQFCDAMDDASYRLRSVLNNILFYSNLPIDVRKTLVQNALSQYETFVVGIMDSLPRQVLTAVARSANSKEQVMTTQANGGAAPAAGKEGTEAELTIKRSDLEKMITDGVAAALAAQKPATTEATRSAPATEAGKEGAPAAAAPAAAEAAAPAAGTLTIEAIRSAVAEVVKPIDERMAKLEGQTIVRSTGDDPAQTEVQRSAKTEVPKNADGSTNMNEVFRGALPGISGRQKRAAQ